jgi:flagellar biosynthesis GTPase FlhF
MYVKKFEGDTLDDALKMVKRELGPDAIILKTITNKGLKGAFKKNKIEITAAISEESYSKKARVDHVLDTDQREQFYNAPATEVNTMIDNYNENSPQKERLNGGYGGLGLNKVVNSVSTAGSKIKSGLDDFLSTSEGEATPNLEDFIPERQLSSHQNSHQRSSSNLINEAYSQIEEVSIEPVQNNHVKAELTLELKQEIKHQKNQIELLEKKLNELSLNMTSSREKIGEPEGLKELKTTLKTLDLNDKIISKIIKKANFELSATDLEDEDYVYDFALRELNSLITTAMPLFSDIKMQNKPVVTALISEASSGQSSMALKLSTLCENSRVIQFRTQGIDKANNEFAAQVFNLDIVAVDSIAHLMSEARKATEQGKSIFLDIKTNAKDIDESKKIIDSLKRSMDNLEILVNISAINSEIYNRKILAKYKEFANGVIISYVDQCLNFGSIINAHISSELPLKFFGTGQAVPDDIEAATSERLLAGMFDF